MITHEELKQMSSGTFMSGEVIDSPEGINMTNSGKMLKWVARRGMIADWAIYVGWSTSSFEEIERSGDKVFGVNNIKKLVNCDEEMLKHYRR